MTKGSQVYNPQSVGRPKRAQHVHLPSVHVLLYGHMLTDIEIIAAELRGLWLAAGDYRSKLRVVRGAAKRLEERAAKLLGDA